MSKARFDRLDAGKQRRLMECAAEEFGAKGYDAASLNRILECAGMSKSSLYYYFEDKADLFSTLVERSLKVIFEALGTFDLSLLTADNFWDECEALYLRCADVLSGDEWYVKLGRMFYRVRTDSLEDPTERMFEEARRWIEALLTCGQGLGVIRQDLPAGLLAASAIGLGEALDRWVLANWETLDPAEMGRLASDHMDMFRRLLRP